jgi:NADH-quinone oxidoreductase subunit J
MGASSVEGWKKHLAELEAIALHARNRLGSVPPPETASLSNLSGPPPTVKFTEVRRDPATGLPQVPAENAAYLGRSLFTDFLLPVELGGTLLLVATIGAIAIAQRRSSSPPAGQAPQTRPGRLS